MTDPSGFRTTETTISYNERQQPYNPDHTYTVLQVVISDPDDPLGDTGGAIEDITISLSNTQDFIWQTQNPYGQGKIEKDGVTYGYGYYIDGSVQLINPPDYETQSTFTTDLIFSDGVNTRSLAITVNIEDIEEAPVFKSSSSFNAAENQTSVGTVVATDGDGDGLSYTINGNDSALFSIGSSSGVLTFQSAPDYETQNYYSLTAQVCDDVSPYRCASQNITVNVTDVYENIAPTISSSATFSAAENQTAIGSVSASDADGDSLTYSISGSEINISSSGVLTFASAPDYETKSSYSATVTVSDGTALVTQAITVNVTNVNDIAPVFSSSATFSVAENQTAIGTVIATDADGDSLTYSIAGSEINISSSGVLTFASAPDYETKNSYSATVTVSDGTASATQNITVNVTDVAENTGPVISGLASSVSVAENQTAVVTISASDANGDTLTYSLSGTDASSFSINSSGVIAFNSAPDYETKTSYSITVQVSDGSISPSQALTVNVTNVNEAPISQSQPQGSNFSENSTGVVFRANSFDPDSGDLLSFSLTGDDASDLTIDSNGDVRFASTPDYESPADANTDNRYEFNIVVTDSGGLTATSNSSILIGDIAHTWKQRGSDIDGDSNGHSFGYSVALSLDGNYLVAGDPRAPNGSKNLAGMVRVFYWDGSSWAQKGSSYLGEDQNDRNGFSVSISDDGQTISSSAPGDNNGKGYGRVLEWDGSNYTNTYGYTGNEYSSVYPPSLLTSNGDKMVSVFGAGDQVVVSYSSPNWTSGAGSTSVSIDVGLPFDMALNTWPSGSSDETNTIEMTLVDGGGLKSWVVNARNYNGCSQDWCVYSRAPSVSLGSDGACGVDAVRRLTAGGKKSSIITASCRGKGGFKIFDYDPDEGADGLYYDGDWNPVALNLDGISLSDGEVLGETDGDHEDTYGGNQPYGHHIAATEDSSDTTSLGTYIAFGSPGYTSGGMGDVGQVRIYHRPANSLAITQIGDRIVGEAESDSSGVAVDISNYGATVAIGAPGNDSNGHVRVYDWKE
jgi:hypothetical protein